MIKNRIELLQKLNEYILQNNEDFQLIKNNAERQNAWFSQEFIEHSFHAITSRYLHEEALEQYTKDLQTAESTNKTMTIGITMAGNIPLVGFHDFLTVFLSGHKQRIKFSSKDNVLLPHLIEKLYAWDENVRLLVSSSEMLKACDAYIATGSNNSAIYFEKYFARFPHIIRRNRTSVAILTGNESLSELELLADDVYMYFGLGCRNVTKLYVPENYDFIPLLQAFKKYDQLKHHNKYRNNLDYNLAVFILNNQYYMSNESILLIENQTLFSAIGVLHYEQYSDMQTLLNQLQSNTDIQAIISTNTIPFGAAQSPSLTDFADGVNTIDFINTL